MWGLDGLLQLAWTEGLEALVRLAWTEGLEGFVQLGWTEGLEALVRLAWTQELEGLLLDQMGGLNVMLEGFGSLLLTQIGGLGKLGMVVQLGLFCHLVSALKERRTYVTLHILHIMYALAFR